MQRIERKQKLLRVPLGAILDLLIPVSDNSVLRKIKLPDDVRPISAFWDGQYQEFMILIESNKFETVDEYSQIPKMEFDYECIKAVPICKLEETKICIDNDVTRIWIDTPSASDIEYARQILSRLNHGSRFNVPDNFEVVEKTKEDK